MCEILNENFDESFGEISSNIQKASFIAIDTEFTGLDIGIDDVTNLFDSVEGRYSKLKTKAKSFIICQFGLSAFVKIEKENRYEAFTYNFYICPRSQGLLDSKFLWEVSSIEFLCQYKFDFNKFAYYGLSYLNEEDEDNLRKMLNKMSTKRLYKRHMNEFEVNFCCSQVANWLSNKSEDELVVSVSRSLADYVVHKEIRSRFQEVWTFYSPNKQVIVKKVSAVERAELMNSNENELENKLMEEFLGFTKVFNCLLTHKKPLIGHNLLTDLILMYNQFYKPLPKSFGKFKSDIKQMFPQIYDTKSLAYSLSKIHPNCSALKSTSLIELYKSLSSHSGLFYVLCQPSVRHAKGFERYSKKNIPHEAGYDAYISGYVFVRMAHINTQMNKTCEQQQPESFNKLLSMLEPFRGCLNLIRARTDHIRLDGDDPPIKRPQWLVVESKSRKPLNVSEIMEICSSYDSVDVRLINQFKAVIAIATFRGARSIYKDLNHSFNVSIYNSIRHNPTLKTFLWCCVGACGALGIAVLLQIKRH
ncbi:Poly(A)-specific ribonuclease pnldc1 [Chamberlinius hualienensis]